MLQNLIQTNPKHAPGWIAAASLEGKSCILDPCVSESLNLLVHAKKMVQARKIIAEGCERCPNSEDVWFHAAELNVSQAHQMWTRDETDDHRRHPRMPRLFWVELFNTFQHPLRSGSRPRSWRATLPPRSGSSGKVSCHNPAN